MKQLSSGETIQFQDVFRMYQKFAHQAHQVN